MTLLEFVREVEEKTHLGEMEILELVRRNWPRHTMFNQTQAALLVQHIERQRRVL